MSNSHPRCDDHGINHLTSIPPMRHAPSLRQRLRARRLNRRDGVELAPGALIGRAVSVEVSPGARLRIGACARIGDRTRFLVRAGAVEIGEQASLGERCTIVAHAGVQIAPRATLGDEVTILDFDHRFADPELPIRVQGLTSERVSVGEGAILGPRAAVLRGARVGAGARVGPLAVVKGEIAPGAVVEGVPARAPGPPPPRHRRKGGR
jgi:acetyltransferase-like isoleucine patch superfamily enzyme